MSSNFRRGNQNRVAPKSQGREFPSQTLVSGHSQRDFRFIPSTSTVATSFDEGPKRSHVPVNRGVPTSSSKGAFGDREKDSAASSFTAGQADQSSASSVEDYDAPVDKARGKHRFKSYQLDGKYDQPWVSDPRMNRTRWNNWILRAFMFIGVALSAYICFSATQTVGKHSYCLVYQDDFKTLDTNVWTHEVQIDGFGNGCFDWTTTDSKNSYVDATGLHIVPTLTNETTTLTNEQILNGGKLNLTKSAGDGTCTGTELRSCAIASNSTTGRMLPPVRSARLTTKGKKSIRYGKVEVVAKMPRGDWIWPAIWMMPVDSKYGVWPRSGEIDIVESRGNDVDYSPGGRDVLTSTLHWGPTTIKDAFWRTTAGKNLRRDDFTNKFHTYGMEWTEDYIYTYLDSQLVQVLFTGFKGQNLWDLGKFATAEENKTLLANPWPSKSLNAPFDQDFYLILNVAVGGINGWFPDGIDAKPWLNAADSPQRDFYKGVDTWLPTWGEGDKRGMTVRSVKMWQQGACS
ncbi:putative gram-negative bacteria binding protein [Tothia fuscella]|uniref:Gram-negative bacteria binding protein n=1 Tax=Tothia fuscella TaxID=1048955 RepID=A0A9P4TYR4_9PEZI|nr:putative gram-negative bacteria binding protein [Tothia fuscella]